MAYEQRDMSGTLFKNNKRTTEKSPEYTGKCLIDGKEVRIAAWVKDGRNGKFFSLAFSYPDAQRDVPRETKPDFDDPLPF